MKFKGKPRPVGVSYVVTIPKALIEGGIMSVDKEYTFEVTEAENELQPRERSA